MVGKKKKINKKNNFPPLQNTTSKLLSDVKKLEKGTFKPFNTITELTTKLPLDGDQSDQTATEKQDDQNQTRSTVYQDGLNYRFEASESRISENTGREIASIKDTFRKELSDHKNSILKWLFGLIVAIIIGFIGLYFPSLSILKKEISNDLNKSFDAKIEKLEKSDRNLLYRINNIKN